MMPPMTLPMMALERDEVVELEEVAVALDMSGVTVALALGLEKVATEDEVRVGLVLEVIG